MPATDKPPMKSDVTVWTGAKQAAPSRNLDVVLRPISRPDLGEIQVEEAVFTIGRTEHPFDTYGNDVLNMLSRRHASIFRKEGNVFVVDQQSRNGTTVNRMGIGHEPCQLRDGDEICFGGSLSYCIQITPRVRPQGSLTLMLTPESADSGLETIVVSKFPLVVSKTDGVFGHYKSDAAHGDELKYLSRRHAHIYQKGDKVYVGDLGSANGTFLDGERLQEQAVPLQDGAVVAFGGKHFVYKVGIVRATGVEPAEAETRHQLTEQRITIHREALLNREALVARVAAAQPPEPVQPAEPAAAPPLPAPKVESKGLFGIFGRKAASKPAVAAPGTIAATAQSIQIGAAVNSPKAAPAADAAGKQPNNSTPAAAVAPKSVAQPSQSQASAAQQVKPAQQSQSAQQGQSAQPARSAQQSQPAQQAQATPQPQASKSPPPAKPLPAQQAPQQPSKAQQSPPPPQQQSQQPPSGDISNLAMDSGTQFMAAPTTFLTVLCAADTPKKEATPDPAAIEAAAKEANAKRRPRGRVMLLLSELATLIKGEPDSASSKRWRYVAAAAVVLVALATTAYVWNGSERAFKEAIARNDYPRAAALAVRLLDKHPDDIELKAKATDVGLKATVPAWLQKIQSKDFDGAKAELTRETELSKRDTDLRPLIDELEWLGDLEKLVSVRGGPEAPIRIYADEDSIERVISRWNEDTGEHQRALARIASYVPQFVDWYGEALTHLRRLQSESTVYLPVVARVKVNIAAELSRDNPDALKPSLKEIADEYPRLGGMDIVRQDLARYTEIRHEARSKKSGRLFALLEKAQFVTPPFQQSFRALVDSGQLPPADLVHQYNAATQTWREHNSADALAELQKLTATGPWAEYLSRELDRRGTVASSFSSLQLSRDAPDYVERLLAFRETLDADEDVYFVNATSADLTQHKDQVIEKAQDAITQARAHWQEYKNTGAIDASQRIETSVSDNFKTRAKALAEASKYVQQAFTLYSLVDASGANQWTAVRDEIETEVSEQRSRLRDLSNVVEPALLNTKLALLGGDATE